MMTRTSRTIALTAALAAALALAAPARAQDRDRTVDEEFVTKAAVSGLAEVELAELALKQSPSADVKKFARTMIDHHTKANKELKQLAAAANITCPTRLDEKGRAAYEKLAKLDGSSFDTTYVKQQVEAHEDAVDLFEKESERGKVADLKAFAARTLPLLQSHLKMARALEDEHGILGGLKPDTDSDRPRANPPR